MADSNFVLSRGFDAAAALTKRRFVKLSAVDTVTPVTAASDVVVGVSRYDCTAADIVRGKGASVDMMGIAEVETSVGITLGSLVGISANGRAAAAGAGVRLVGVALNTTSGAGEVQTVLLCVPSVLGVGA